MIPTSEFNILDMIDRIYQMAQPLFNAMAPWAWIVAGIMITAFLARAIITYFQDHLDDTELEQSFGLQLPSLTLPTPSFGDWGGQRTYGGTVTYKHKHEYTGTHPNKTVTHILAGKGGNGYIKGSSAEIGMDTKIVKRAGNYYQVPRGMYTGQ